MAKYVVLIDWTEQGVAGFKDSVDRYELASARMEEIGATFQTVYWTLGAHDLVAIVDAPDEETLAAGLLSVASQGAIRTTSMRAFTGEEMRGVIAKAG